MLLLALAVSSSLLVSGLASDYYHQTTVCKPERETIAITETLLETVRDRVTAYDLHYSHHTLEVTSVISGDGGTAVGPSTLTRYVTATVYHTGGLTPLTATKVVARTSRLVASRVSVTELTVTQTTVVPSTATLMVVDTSVVTATRTVSETSEVVSSVVVETETRGVVVSVTSLVTVPVQVARTVTSTEERTVEATVTVTQRHYVTMCYQPKITYDH